jgi:hypothetical protein
MAEFGEDLKDRENIGQPSESAKAITTVLQAANIDTQGLVVPDAVDIDKIDNDVEAALLADRAFRALHIATGRAWIVMGEYAEIVHRRQLWKHLVSDKGVAFGSFKDWCANATSKGRTTVYGEMTLVRELNIPREDLMRITKANAFTLLKIKRRAGASKITRDLIDRAASMDDPSFAKYAQGFLPGAAGDEVEYTIKFRVPESVANVWKETVEMFQVNLQTNDWERIIEHMAMAARDSKFANGNGNLTALEALSNWEAYQRIAETLEATGNPLKRSGKVMDGSRITKGQAEPDAPDAFDANTDAVIDHESIVVEDEDVAVIMDSIDDQLAAMDQDEGWDVANESQEQKAKWEDFPF